MLIDLLTTTKTSGKHLRTDWRQSLTIPNMVGVLVLHTTQAFGAIMQLKEKYKRDNKSLISNLHCKISTALSLKIRPL